MNISRKTIFILCGAIAIALIAFFVWRSRQTTEIANLDSTGTSIVAFGDSLVYGYGSTHGKDFVSLLSTRVGQPIINMGKSGDTTTSALERLDSVLAANPRVVIVLLGGNDLLRRVPIDTTFANLDTIVDAIQAHGSAVLLLGIRGGLLSDPFAARFSAFAEEHHAAYVPNVLDGLLGHREYMSDEIHPNDAGYERVAAKVAPVLEGMLRK
jgi:lysophospholipase L1-like esterase